MASSSKKGLRCDASRVVGVNRVKECGGLILEQDQKQGLGVRCYKKDCSEFHPLEVSLSRAVEENLLSPDQRDKIRKGVSEGVENPASEWEDKEMSEAMYVFTLHEDEKDFRVKGTVLARSPREAASILGGEFVEVEGWPMASSTNRDELGLFGKIRFAQELFRCHSDQELARIKLDYSPGPYYERGSGLLIWEKRGKSGEEFVLRRNPVTLPAYTYFC